MTDVRILHAMADKNWAETRTAVESLLDKRGWSQAELARRSGVDADTIGAFLAGTRNPRPSTLRRLAQAAWPEADILVRVLDGELTSKDTTAQLTDSADDTPIDFRSGTGDVAELNRLRAEEAQLIGSQAEEMIADILDRADLSYERRPNGPVPADFIVDTGRARIPVEVKVGYARDAAGQHALVGEAWEAADAGAPIVYVAVIDWPDELIQRVEKAGAIYATPADVIKKLTTIGEQ